MKKIITAALLFFCVATTAAAQQLGATASPSWGTVVGTQSLNPVTSTSFTVPATAEWALVSIRNAGIHMSYDGQAATTAGDYFPPGRYWTPVCPGGKLSVYLANNRFINSSDGTAIVYVTYFTRR